MRDLLITDFGAVGDGTTLCTQAIQKAIDACCGGEGERVVIPRGTFVTGTLFLHSCMELHFAPGSVLLASMNAGDYPVITSSVWNTEYAPRKDSRCLLYAEAAHHLSITGAGTVECRGMEWCEPDPSEGRINEYRRRGGESIPRVLLMVECTDFSLSDFCIHDSPAGWAAWLLGCARGNVQGLCIRSDRRMPNADGLHINCCQDLTISSCRFDTGDDALILRAYNSPLKRPRACERIAVSNCLLSSHSCAVRIGWCNDGAIRDCTITNCVITDSTSGVVIQLPKFAQRVADQGTDRTVVENILISHVVMRQIFFEPIHITMLDADGVDRISGVRFMDLSCTSRLPIRLNGLEEKPIENIEIVHSAFRKAGPLETTVPVPKQYWNQHAYDGLPQVCHVKNLRMTDVTFDW